MPSNLSPEAVLRKAKQQEKEFNWLEAAQSYEQLLKLEPDDVSLVTEMWEKIGLCYGLASRQTGDSEGFKQLRRLSAEAYNNAAKLFAEEDDLEKQGKSAQCHALAEYVGSWLASDPSEEKTMLDECLKSGKRSLTAYESAGNTLGYGKVCNDILICLIERQYVASDWKEMNKIATEGTEYADKAIAVLSKLEDKSELLRAYSASSLQSWYAANISEDEEKRKELVQKSLSCAENALKLSKEIDDPYLAAMSNWTAAVCTLLFTEKAELSLEYAKEMLKQAEIARDNYLKGVASYVLAFVTNLMVLSEADPEKKKEKHEKTIKYAEDAIRYLHLVSQNYFIAEACLYYAESYSSLVDDVEASLEEKQRILEKAVGIGRRGLEYAVRSGSPDATGSTLHALSKALQMTSNFESNKHEKIRLLEEALTRRKEYNSIVEKAFTTNDWTNGVGKNYEGLIKRDLARLETDKDKKRVLFESAVSDMEEGRTRCRRLISSNPVPSLMAAVGMFEDGLGEILNELHFLTEDKEVLRRAVEVYGGAAEDFKKVGLPSRVAESYWKMARNQDLLASYHKAAESFEHASVEYKDAAQKTPHFADFYLDHATYMEAWSEIEKAKATHKQEEYANAMEHYEKTAVLLKSSKSWKYLSSNFLGWSFLEQAENLSRKEKSTESIEAFIKASELFEKAKGAIEEEVGIIRNLDEKENAIELCRASVRRKDYCMARANLEEAKIFDRKGNHGESAEKYESATIAFEKMLETAETEGEREEIKPIACMCKAWRKMKMADVKVSPELYSEASELFLEAKKCSIKDRVVLLTSGNSAFCKALEHGTKFEAARDRDDFSKVKQYLGIAANYYLKAGFESASVWTNATEILFDAYNYMINAEVEVDPEKKVKTYLLAEKCLERSAGLYERAGFVGKRDEVLRTIGEVREKREFALSLGEMLDVPSDASSTRVIPAPAMTAEEPVGGLKFEGAFVHANLIAPQTEIMVGGNIGMEIHMANLGKTAAFLINVGEVIPEGFELVEKPEKCIVDRGFLNLKGRKLAALETDEMKFTLKPKKKGRFVFAPKIQYKDESGESKFDELERVSVTVKELGIRGWLKGSD